MKLALINPPWSFEHSIYFGCREPHLPLELGAAKVLLERAGHDVKIFDGHLFGMTMSEVADAVRAFRPDMSVITTAPSYLFWRCAPPELRVPQQMLSALGGKAGMTVTVGPHVSTTPRTAIAKLRTDFAIMGECEEALVRLAEGEREFAGLVWREDEAIELRGGPLATRFADLPPLEWPDAWIARHRHHHHRFDGRPEGPGAEVEASRGCPYHCSFCAKENFRDGYRRRELSTLKAEIVRLEQQGVRYLYFIDEIFLPSAPLLEFLCSTGLKFGIQTRIDLWKPAMLELLGRAGCVSIEAGIESLSEEGRNALDKSCRMSTDALTERLLLAKSHVAFVQGNLIAQAGDDPADVARWRRRLQDAGVWANDPVPLFPYPGSPDYRKLWGTPDDRAWERAVDHYLSLYGEFSDIQDAKPKPLAELEQAPA